MIIDGPNCSTDEMDAWCVRLIQLGLSVRDRLRDVHGGVQGGDSAVARTPLGERGGDVIYALDDLVEPVLVRQISTWPTDCFPLVLVAEGINESGQLPFDAGGQPSQVQTKPAPFRLLIDPIDGTRSLMYDKRPAWFLAGVADDRGKATGVQDIFAAVMVELPTSNQARADHFWATRASVTRMQTLDCTRTVTREWRAAPIHVPQPSPAVSLDHGFAHVVNFFPGTKVLAAELMEAIARGGVDDQDRWHVFNDQYLATGGQMAELIRGRDRFCGDFRPLFHRLLGASGVERNGLECHPYDVAAALVAQQAGAIITDPFGKPLAAPMTVDHGVSWCGYANAALQARIEPVIQRWLAAKGLR